MTLRVPSRRRSTEPDLELREKLARSARVDDVGALADREMAAVGDHAQRRAQPARVLHAVGERHPVVVGPPEAEARAARRGRGRRADRRRRAPGPAVSVSVCCGRPCEERLRHLGIEPDRIGDAPPAEGERAARAATARHGRGAGRRAARADDADAASPSPRRSASTRRSPPPRRGRCRVTASGRRTAARSATSAAERVADPRRRAGRPRARPPRAPRRRTGRASRRRQAARSRRGRAAPGRSRAARAASAGATSRQFVAAPPRPWTSTSGGPSPPTR